MHDLLLLWMEWVENWGYWGVIILMAMESSIFPVPSELVIPPAAILAAQGQGMSYWGIILSGTFGSYLGSIITYGIARWVGRPFVLRYGKYFFMPEKKIKTAEFFLASYSTGGVFFARLLPVIRHLISIPAGIVRMNIWTFSAVTCLGAFIWCWILTWYGDRIGRENPELMKSPEDLIATVKSESLGLIICIVVLAALYILMIRLTKKQTK